MAEDTPSATKPVTSGSQRRRRRPRELGQSVIEFAIAAPILLTVLLGLIEIGNGLNSYIKVISVARDAARLGAQDCTGVSTACDTNLRSLISKELESLPGNESWVSTDICSSNTAGTCIQHFNDASTSNTNAVRVRVCYDHSLLIGLPGVIPNPLRLCSSATMRVMS